MPRPSNWTELEALDKELASAKLAHRAAMNHFTETADKLNRLLFEQHDYYQYLTQKAPIPLWLKDLETKKWLFTGTSEIKGQKKAHHKTTSTKAKDKIASKMYSKLIGGFK